MEGMKCEQHVLGIVLGEEPPDFGMFLCPTLGRPLAVWLLSSSCAIANHDVIARDWDQTRKDVFSSRAYALVSRGSRA